MGISHSFSLHIIGEKKEITNLRRCEVIFRSLLVVREDINNKRKRGKKEKKKKKSGKKGWRVLAS